MEKNIEPGSAKDKKSKEDEDILELAEELLNSSDDEIIGLDENAVVTADEDDDVIDLTDVSDQPLTDEDEILDLTSELQQSEPDNDITIAEDDEIMELEDITDVSADTEVAILELDEAIDALGETKEESVTLDDIATEPEETIIDLHDTAEAEESAPGSEPASATPAFTIETDTIELTDSDRVSLEQEFGFETEDEGLPEVAAIEDVPAEEDLLSGTTDQDLADTIDLTDTLDDTNEVSPAQQPTEFPEEPIELTDDDRATLEEELGADTGDDISIDMADTVEATELEDQQSELPGEAPEPLTAAAPEEEVHMDAESPAPDEIGWDQPEQEPIAEAEIRFDAEELSMTDDADEEPAALGIDSEDELTESPPDALQQTMELADVNGEALQAEIDSETADPVFAAGEPQEVVSEEILDVGLDEDNVLLPDEPMPEETDASLAVEGLGLTEEPAADMMEPGVSGSEEFTIGSPEDAPEDEGLLTAEALTGADMEPGSDISISADTPSGTTFDPEEEGSALEDAAPTVANGMSVDFDQTENFEQSDLHKDADPISIRVKEPTTEDNADEDALLNKVFEPQPDAELPKDLEQTVERVVGKMLADKIEVILADAIETAVEKEIGRLKQLLLDDLNRLE